MHSRRPRPAHALMPTRAVPRERGWRPAGGGGAVAGGGARNPPPCPRARNAAAPPRNHGGRARRIGASALAAPAAAPRHGARRTGAARNSRRARGYSTVILRHPLASPRARGGEGGGGVKSAGERAARGQQGRGGGRGGETDADGRVGGPPRAGRQPRRAMAQRLEAARRLSGAAQARSARRHAGERAEKVQVCTRGGGPGTGGAGAVSTDREGGCSRRLTASWDFVRDSIKETEKRGFIQVSMDRSAADRPSLCKTKSVLLTQTTGRALLILYRYRSTLYFST